MRLTRMHWAVLAIVVIIVLAAGLWAADAAGRRPAPIATSYSPLPHPVLAEVFNAGVAAGGAAVGTALLRHAGIDVVLSGNAPAELSGRAHNQVLVRRGDTTGVGRIIEALGQAEVIVVTDSTRLVDLTVLLGKSFVPPTPRVNPSH